MVFSGLILTVPCNRTTALVSVKLSVLTVSGFMAFAESCTDRLLVATLEAAGMGLTLVMVGAVTSSAAALNCQM